MRNKSYVDVNQMPIDVLSEGATDEQPKMSKIGQLFTANWQTRLVLAGKVHRVSIGTIAGGTGITMIGTGTVIDLEMPQIGVAADSGYLIPIELQLGLNSLADAASNQVEVLMTTDRITALGATEIATSTGTVETPLNLLDGAEAFGGRAFSKAAVAIADPVHADVLYYAHWMAMGTAVNTVEFVVNKTWNYPNFIQGACTLYVYWAGTVATTAIGSLVFAHIPLSWVPVE